MWQTKTYSEDKKKSLQGSNVTVAYRLLMCVALAIMLVVPSATYAQPDAVATTKLDARRILVGDRARLFLEVTNKPAAGSLHWAAIPDTFNSLEILERGKIDTVVAGDAVTYKQRLIITGFDSGMFKIPAFPFYVTSPSGDSFYIQSDSFELLVQTVAVDTAGAFKPIKNIIYVAPSWKDYIWYIVGGVVLVALIVLGIVYLVRRKKPQPIAPEGPKETLQEQALRQLSELEAKQLWQQQQVKEYYIELTDIVRNYIEDRFKTPAMELTTDELLQKAKIHRDLLPYYDLLSIILQTADLAKFAKAQPLPQEHTDAIDKARELVVSSKPIIVVAPTDKTT